MSVSANFGRLKFLDSITLHSSESDVEHKIIIPLLQTLGYHDRDWKTQVTFGKVKVDFLVQLYNPKCRHLPYLVIETKAPRQDLSRNLWQLQGYLRDTGAVLGLLTNGYQFDLLYHYDGKIGTIASYSQQTLIEDFSLFYTLCSRETCLKLSDSIHQSHQQVHSNFISHIATIFERQNMFDLFKRRNFAGEAIEPATSQTTQEIAPLEQDLIALEQELIERQGTIITVFNNKGGVGKTTTTINLAAALNKLGKRVLLIDIDAQANLTMGLGIDPLNDVEEQGKKDISHLITEARTLLPDVIISKEWGDIELDVVPSNINLIDLENKISQNVDVHKTLYKKIKKYRYEYDYIFIDPPPSFGLFNTMSLIAASATLIPTQLAPYPVRALEYVLGRMRSLDQLRDAPLPILGIVISMYDKKTTTLQHQMTKKIKEILVAFPNGENINLFPQETWIPQLKVVSSTPEKGYPLCYAEFDTSLNRQERETAQDAFNCYVKMAQYLMMLVEANNL